VDDVEMPARPAHITTLRDSGTPPVFAATLSRWSRGAVRSGHAQLLEVATSVDRYQVDTHTPAEVWSRKLIASQALGQGEQSMVHPGAMPSGCRRSWLTAQACRSLAVVAWA